MTLGEHSLRVASAVAALPGCRRVEINSAASNGIPRDQPGSSHSGRSQFYTPGHLPEAIELVEPVVALHVCGIFGRQDERAGAVVTAAVESLSGRPDLQPIASCTIVRSGDGLHVQVVLVDGPTDDIVRPPVTPP